MRVGTEPNYTQPCSLVQRLSLKPCFKITLSPTGIRNAWMMGAYFLKAYCYTLDAESMDQYEVERYVVALTTHRIKLEDYQKWPAPYLRLEH